MVRRAHGLSKPPAGPAANAKGGENFAGGGRVGCADRPAGRLLASSAYWELKAATRQLIRKAGGLESAATVTRVRAHQTLARYASPNHAETAPIDVIADLEADTGDAGVTRTLARLAGLVVFALPDAGADAVWARGLGAAARETGEAIAAIGEAIAEGPGGTVTVEESHRLRLREQVAEAVAALASIQAALDRLEN